MKEEKTRDIAGDDPIVWGISVDDTKVRVITIDDCRGSKKRPTTNGIHNMVIVIRDSKTVRGHCRRCQRELAEHPGDISEELQRRAPKVEQGGS